MNAALTLFCETRTERSVEVLRVKIWTPLPPDVTDILGIAQHKRDRHPSNGSSQTVTVGIGKVVPVPAESEPAKSFCLDLVSVSDDTHRR
jgi:hypothetical protein